MLSQRSTHLHVYRPTDDGCVYKKYAARIICYHLFFFFIYLLYVYIGIYGRLSSYRPPVVKLQMVLNCGACSTLHVSRIFVLAPSSGVHLQSWAEGWGLVDFCIKIRRARRKTNKFDRSILLPNLRYVLWLQAGDRLLGWWCNLPLGQVAAGVEYGAQLPGYADFRRESMGLLGVPNGG